MPLPYSQDLRDRMLLACNRGMKTKQVSDLFCVSPAWGRRVKQRRRENSEVSPRPPTPKTRRTKIDRTRLAELVREQSDATLAELRDRLGIVCSMSAIWKALDRMGFTFKKRQSMRLSRIEPMSLFVEKTGKQAKNSSIQAG